MTNKKKWFESWFDTPYYHLLYKHRDDKEAHKFIKNLMQFLKIDKDQNILDLACGKGRHSIFLNKLGYRVTGVDLSSQNILQAQKHSNSRLNFGIHDMRNPMDSKFDLILNMFTSFGYFDSDDDDKMVLSAVKNSLNKDGIAVIDFMNTPNIINALVPKNHLCIEGVDFQIERFFDGSHIRKNIRVKDCESVFNYKEQVRAYSFNDFKKMLQGNGFKLLNACGSYDLESFNEKTSERLILIFKIHP